MRGRQLESHGRADLWQNLPVLVVVLWGGFFTNFIWSAILIIRNRSAAQFLGAPGINPDGSFGARRDADGTRPAHASIRAASDARERSVSNYLLASLAGVIWYFQFFFYSMGQTLDGQV